MDLTCFLSETWDAGPLYAMSTLSWNCHDLGNPQTVRDVLNLVSKKKPGFVYLMETKIGRSHAERLRVWLGFEGCFCVDSAGLSGGLFFLVENE